MWLRGRDEGSQLPSLSPALAWGPSVWRDTPARSSMVCAVSKARVCVTQDDSEKWATAVCLMSSTDYMLWDKSVSGTLTLGSLGAPEWA